MKSLNLSELDQLCESLEAWAGYQLQEVRLFGDDFYFGFYGDSKTHWLLVSLRVTSPVCFVIDEHNPPRKNQTKKPLLLFLKSNFVGRKFESIIRKKEYGRVLFIEFEGFMDLEIRLFPHGQNITARVNKKQVSYNKLKDLEKLTQKPEEAQPVRSFVSLEKEFFNQKSFIEVKNKPVVDKEALYNKRQKKLSKAILKVEKDLAQKMAVDWFSRAQELQLKKSMTEISQDEYPFVDFSQNLVWNIERCFSESKKQKVKLIGHKERLDQLKKELSELENGGVESITVIDSKAQKTPQIKLKSKHKKMKLSEQSFIVVGKSAKDNHNLLREAAPYDIWLHLRDYPSSHGILRRNKNYEVSDDELDRAIQFLIKQNFGHKFEQYKGEKFDIIVAEKRYVKPIKGDAVGRVNFHSERTLNCLFK